MLAAEHSKLPPVSPPPPLSAIDLCRLMRETSGAGARGDLPGLDRLLCHDPARAAVEVQAGARWHALSALIGADFMAGTIGASVAANRPGPDGRPVIAHVQALTLATADGHLQRVRRDRSPELFSLAIGGFGAFGTFYSITLDLDSLARAAAACIPGGQADGPAITGDATRFEVELLLPPAAETSAQREVRALLEEHRHVPEFVQARRVCPESESFLRWARRDYTALRIAFRSRATLGAVVSAAQLRGRLIGLAIRAGGSFMPDALPYASRAQIETCYPMFPAFLAEKRRLDPAGRILNTWYRETCRAWRGESCRVRWLPD
ncbi:MAG: hypothetical protein AB7S87_01160 [Burkholderiales bacterium]